MISENVVILTKDEYRERLEREFRRGVDSIGDDKDELYKRAALEHPNMGVMFSTDGAARVHIAQSLETGLNDCLSIRWFNEQGNPNNYWYTAHFSPARARLIARELVQRAVLLEETHGVVSIDPIPEKMRKGRVQ